MIEIGNLGPLRKLAASITDWERHVRMRPGADDDPVALTLGSVRQQLAAALKEAAHVELELTAQQYAALQGITTNALYKRWQRGKLPEAQMRGGKLVFPVSLLIEDAAA